MEEEATAVSLEKAAVGSHNRAEARATAVEQREKQIRESCIKAAEAAAAAAEAAARVQILQRKRQYAVKRACKRRNCLGNRQRAVQECHYPWYLVVVGPGMGRSEKIHVQEQDC